MRNRTDISDLLAQGEGAARAGHRGEARHNFRAVLMLDPSNASALLWLAWLSDDPRASLAYIARVLDHEPDNPRAHTALQWARRQATVSLAEEALTPEPGPETAGLTLLHRPGLLAVLGLLVVVVAVFLVRLLPGNLPTSVALAPSPSPLPTRTATAVVAVTVTSPANRTSDPTATPTPNAVPTRTCTPPPSPTASPTASATATAPPNVLPTAPPLPPSLTPAPISTISSNVKWIDVDLTHQQLTAYEGKELVRFTNVSTGLPRTPTPVGQFHIWIKLRYDDMSGAGYYLPNVPYVMYFHRGYGLHGTYWHANFGYPMSHGCVNLPTEEAEWLYFWADVGTMVNVHY